MSVAAPVTSPKVPLGSIPPAASATGSQLRGQGHKRRRLRTPTPTDDDVNMNTRVTPQASPRRYVLADGRPSAPPSPLKQVRTAHHNLNQGLGLTSAAGPSTLVPPRYGVGYGDQASQVLGNDTPVGATSRMPGVYNAPREDFDAGSIVSPAHGTEYMRMLDGGMSQSTARIMTGGGYQGGGLDFGMARENTGMEDIGGVGLAGDADGEEDFDFDPNDAEMQGFFNFALTSFK